MYWTQWVFVFGHNWGRAFIAPQTLLKYTFNAIKSLQSKLSKTFVKLTGYAKAFRNLYGVLPEGMKQSSFFFLHSTLYIQPISFCYFEFSPKENFFNLENFRFLARWWFGGFSLSEWFHIMLLCFRYHLSSIFYWSMLYFLCHVTSVGSLIWPKWPPIWTFELFFL